MERGLGGDVPYEVPNEVRYDVPYDVPYKVTFQDNESHGAFRKKNYLTVSNSTAISSEETEMHQPPDQVGHNTVPPNLDCLESSQLHSFSFFQHHCSSI